MNILIARKTYDREPRTADESDDMLPGDRLPSSEQEPGACFARKRVVKYSFIKLGHRAFDADPPI
jgi:hypothetical protein